MYGITVRFLQKVARSIASLTVVEWVVAASLTSDGPRSHIVNGVKAFREAIRNKEPPCELPREDMRTLEEATLRTKYRDAKKPVLLTHATEGWAAAETWSQESFLARFGHLEFSRQDDEARSHPGRSMVLSDAFASDVASHENLRFFLREDEYTGLHASIQDDVRWPNRTDRVAATLKQIRGQRILSIASLGTSNRIHRHAEAWQAQLHGLKLWWLVDPEFIPLDSAHDEFGHWGSDTCAYVSKRAAPLSRSFRCVVGPNSAIFVPDGYYHGTCALDAWTLAYGAQGVKAPLAYIMSEGNEVNLRHALENNAIDVTGAAEDGTEMLHWSAIDGHAAILRLLSESRADVVKSQRKDGSLAIHLAAKAGHVDVVTVLISMRVDISAFGGQAALQPLHLAASPGHLEVVRLLLSCSADVNAHSLVDGALPIHGSAANGHEEIVRYLLQERALADGTEVADASGWRPVHWAANSGSLPILRLLANHGASLFTNTFERQQPLHIATWTSRSAIAEFLLEHNAVVDARTVTGTSPLHHAAGNGHLEIVNKLLLCRAVLQLPDEVGRQPLHWATNGGHNRVVLVLLENRADVLSAIGDGTQALHIAVGGGHVGVTNSLIAHGASVESNVQDTSPFWMKIPLVRLIATLFAHDRSTIAGRKPLHFAAESGHQTVAQLLISRKAEAIVLDASDQSPLQVAMQNGHQKMAIYIASQLSCAKAKPCPNGFFCNDVSCAPCFQCCKASARDALTVVKSSCDDSCACNPRLDSEL